MFEQAEFQRRVPMNGYGYTRRISWLSVDVMTAGYSLKLPTVLLEQPSEIFSRDGFQNAISSTLSVAEI
jgi:hypothetical protein